MKFDVFHSIGRIDTVTPRRDDRRAYEDFFQQVQLAESLGFETAWVAESHFSSETQKKNSSPVIPNYQGEVGLNADSPQLAHAIFERTERIGFGTAIYNIVGGNGGPIAAADRIRSLAWLNSLRSTPRRLNIGVASGRFPYINAPFGVVARNQVEEVLWPQYKRLILAEALEIFLRLSNDEEVGSEEITRHRITKDLFPDEETFTQARQALKELNVDLDPDEGLPYEPRWSFEPLKLVPDFPPERWQAFMNFVLGSSDPVVRNVGLRFADLDVFNLSFTPPDKLKLLHEEMFARYEEAGRTWHRGRLPRTVLTFIDKDAEVARERASQCFDTYIEAMRGTAAVPPKEVLMDRALIGTGAMIREQISPENPQGFHPDDRLMVWFEFNQTDSDAICDQMRLFADEVMAHFGSSQADSK